jgi:hypothetical protein
MAFPVSPTEGQTFTENNTVWIYSAVTGQWNRSVINPLNETLYVFGSASATGAAGEIQYTDGSRLAASPNLVWDDVNDELEVGGDVVLDDGGTFTTTLQTVTPTQNRTISFPNATGTVGLVAGSSGHVVYNNAGRYAGISILTFDGIDVIQSSGRYLLGVTSANANGGTLQLSGGITFPATQVAATDPNTLDDYEEGTFTPTIIGISTAGAGTYTTQTGRYTKVGSSVFYAITVTWTAHTGTGTMRIAGLPFTASSVSGVAPASAIYVSNMTLPASTTAQANVVTNTAQINIVSVPVGGGADASVTLDAAASISVSGYYII